MLITPRVSEKAYAMAQTGTYVFNVPLNANKEQVSAVVAKQYGVVVKDVRCMIIKGKAVKAYRGKRQNPGTAHRKDMKKAYVSLAPGSSIELFKEEETK
ncbi:50S ribosomal protein L23 [Pedobacter sp.]|nr:50S ribosomal protein L23 [Candidatus Saccharibacteria bacterium]